MEPEGREAKGPRLGREALRLIEQPMHGDHIVQFYEGDDVLCASVARFIAAGLHSGQSVVVVATDEHRALIEARLHDESIDVRAACHSEQLFILNAQATLASFMRAGQPSWDLFRAEVGPVLERASMRANGAGVRAYGEMVDVLRKADQTVAALQLEDHWNRISKEFSFSLLCAYDMGGIDNENHACDYSLVCETHSHVLPSEIFSGTLSTDDQMRQIGMLQQRARALQTEVKHRRRLEADLRGALREQLRAEEALRSNEAELREASRAKDQFLAMLGHELRNPLAPIATALQLMSMRLGDTAIRERSIIERQVTHLVRLVEDLLDVSRLAEGKVELVRTTLDLADVVATAVEMVSPLLEQRRHTLVVSVPRGELYVDGDERRLAQVAANLLNNAAKYTGVGGRIELAGARVGSDVTLRVRDNGAGISSELLPRIFEPFIQGDRPLDRREGGLGLGLAIVRSLVTLHGGGLQVHSEGRGRGSEFIVRLPAADHTAASAPRGRLSLVRPEPRSAAHGTVVVVDDNVDAAEAIADVIKELGYNVKIAHDGAEGLSVIESTRPDMALVDIGLPSIDGYELARRVRANGRNDALRLIAVTGYGQERDRDMSKSAGFDEHLVKPVRFDDLQRLLSTIASRAVRAC